MEGIAALKKEIECLQAENLQLREENESLRRSVLQMTATGQLREKAKEAIQRKKAERIKAYQLKMREILSESQDITTKEMIRRLQINNKTFYNLQLDEFFSDGAGI